jgi:hypothetical protein
LIGLKRHAGIQKGLEDLVAQNDGAQRRQQDEAAHSAKQRQRNQAREGDVERAVHAHTHTLADWDVSKGEP